MPDLTHPDSFVHAWSVSCPLPTLPFPPLLHLDTTSTPSLYPFYPRAIPSLPSPSSINPPSLWPRPISFLLARYPLSNLSLNPSIPFLLTRYPLSNLSLSLLTCFSPHLFPTKLKFSIFCSHQNASTFTESMCSSYLSALMRISLTYILKFMFRMISQPAPAIACTSRSQSQSEFPHIPCTFCTVLYNIRGKFAEIFSQCKVQEVCRLKFLYATSSQSKNSEQCQN